jgi:xylulokinase
VNLFLTDGAEEMSDQQLTAGIDLGTSSVKVLLTDGKKTIAKASAPYTEPAPDGWIRSVSRALGNLKRVDDRMRQSFCRTQDSAEASCGDGEERISPACIKAVGLSSQVGTYVVNGKYVLGWQKACGTKELEEARGAFSREDFLREISMDHPDIFSYPVPRIKYMAGRMKRRGINIHSVCQPKEVLLRMLTGRYVSDQYSWRGLANQKNGRYSRVLLDWLGIPESCLPEIIGVTDMAGTITEDAAKATGLREGIPVYTGCNDFYASLLGMGITKAGQMFDITGTSEHVGAVTETLTQRDRCVSSPYPGGNVLYGVTASSGVSLSYGMRLFDLEKLQTETYLAGGLSRAPIFLPYLDGERAPVFDPDASGVFFGIRSGTSKADMAYAVMEGVAFSLLDIRRHLDLPFAPDRIRTAGGASRNHELNQLKADVLGISVEPLAEIDTSAYGACMLACIGKGVYGDPEEAARFMVQTGEQIDPVYHSELAERFLVYKELYKRVRGLKF